MIPQRSTCDGFRDKTRVGVEVPRVLGVLFGFGVLRDRVCDCERRSSVGLRGLGGTRLVGRNYVVYIENERSLTTFVEQP